MWAAHTHTLTRIQCLSPLMLSFTVNSVTPTPCCSLSLRDIFLTFPLCALEIPSFFLFFSPIHNLSVFFLPFTSRLPLPLLSVVSPIASLLPFCIYFLILHLLLRCFIPLFLLLSRSLSCYSFSLFQPFPLTVLFLSLPETLLRTLLWLFCTGVK